MSIVKITFRLTGTTPLLTHNPSGMKPSDVGIGKKKIPTAEEEAAAGLYRNREGLFALPIIAVRSSLLGGCVGRRIGKVGAMRVIGPAVSYDIQDEWLPLLDPRTQVPLKNYEIFVVRAVVNRKSGVLRARPMFRNWMVDAPLLVDTESARAEMVLEIFTFSGREVGLGDWRPQKSGIYGKYTATLI